MRLFSERSNSSTNKMELYIKAGPDGESSGDCPFAHFVRAVIVAKGLECKIIPRTKENKPDWLINDFEGKMPCLKNGDDIIIESSKIVSYLEEKFPENKIECEQDESVLHLTQGLFPSLALFIKQKEYDPKLEKRLADEIGKLDRHMETSGGPYLCRKTVTLADFNLAPKLFHLKITLDHFYPHLFRKIVPVRVITYMDLVLASDPIVSCSYPESDVIAGWTAARE